MPSLYESWCVWRCLGLRGPSLGRTAQVARCVRHCWGAWGVYVLEMYPSPMQRILPVELGYIYLRACICCILASLTWLHTTHMYCACISYVSWLMYSILCVYPNVSCMCLVYVGTHRNRIPNDIVAMIVAHLYVSCGCITIRIALLSRMMVYLKHVWCKL